MPIFIHGWAISVKILVWKFGSDWLSLSRVIVVTDKKKKKKFNFPGGRKSPIRGGGYIWPSMPIFEIGWAIPVKSHVWKFGLDWLKSEVGYVNFRRGGGGGVAEEPLLGGVTCDLQCPFTNLHELLQSKVMCENLIRIGWAFQDLSW